MLINVCNVHVLLSPQSVSIENDGGVAETCSKF